METITWIIILIFAGQIIGSLIGILLKPTKRLVHSSLAFAASLMILLALFRLIPESNKLLSNLTLTISLISGFVIFFIIDKLLPHINPELAKKENPTIRRTVFMLVIGMALHNIPEGFAGGSGLALSSRLGLGIVLILALHDIPENIATIIPLYHMTGSKLRAFFITTLTIFFELFGFLGAYYFLKISNETIGISLAVAAGFMLYISSEEIIPSINFRAYRKECIIAVAMSIIIFILILITLP